MQNAEIISVNIVQMLISLINLIIIYLILNKIFYKPVKAIIKARESEVAEIYKSANKTKLEADDERIYYREKINTVEKECAETAERLLKSAYEKESQVISRAKAKADAMLKDAENKVSMEYKRAEQEIKAEIINLGILLAQKLLEREINIDDHKIMIDEFLSNIDKYQEVN